MLYNIQKKTQSDISIFYLLVFNFLAEFMMEKI